MPEPPKRPKTWYLWLTIPVAFFGFISIFWYRRKKKSNKNEIAEQISQLEQSAKKAQIDPEFIFNCLNSIQELINNNDKKRANTYLAGFVKLTRGVLRASSESTIPLEDDLELLKNYLSLEELRFAHRLKYSIDIDEHVDTFDTMVPSMVVQSIVEHAIREGFTKNSESGAIHVKYQVSGDQLKITVEDDFKGRYKESKESSQETQQLTVAGIGHIRDRLALVESHSEMRVERMQNADGEITGTKTTVDITLN